MADIHTPGMVEYLYIGLIHGLQVVMSLWCAFFIRQLNKVFPGKYQSLFILAFILIAVQNLLYLYYHVNGFEPVDDIIDSIGLPVIILFFSGMVIKIKKVDYAKCRAGHTHLSYLKQLTEETFNIRGNQ